MLPLTWSALNAVLGPKTRALYPSLACWSIPAVVAEEIVSEGMKNCPLGSLRFMSLSAVGSMLAAVNVVPNAAFARLAKLAASRLVSVKPGEHGSFRNGTVGVGNTLALIRREEEQLIFQDRSAEGRTE